MLGYVILSHTMLHWATQCSLCYTIPCYVMLSLQFYAMLCNALYFYAPPCKALLCYATGCAASLKHCSTWQYCAEQFFPQQRHCAICAMLCRATAALCHALLNPSHPMPAQRWSPLTHQCTFVHADVINRAQVNPRSSPVSPAA